MKKDNKPGLFSDKNLMKRVNLSSVRGGGNKSDQKDGHVDTKNDKGGWDTLINSVIDVESTSISIDKPDFEGDKVYPVFGK